MASHGAVGFFGSFPQSGYFLSQSILSQHQNVLKSYPIYFQNLTVLLRWPTLCEGFLRSQPPSPRSYDILYVLAGSYRSGLAPFRNIRDLELKKTRLTFPQQSCLWKRSPRRELLREGTRPSLCPKGLPTVGVRWELKCGLVPFLSLRDLELRPAEVPLGSAEGD